MNNPALQFPGRKDTESSVGNLTYIFYLFYIISFFLHLSARIPGIAVLRPDLLIAALLFIMLFMQQSKLAGRFDNPCNRYLFMFLVYVMISLPFVEWPGSVLRNNLGEFIKAMLFFHFTLLIVDTDARLKRFVLVFMACQLFRVMEPLYLHETTGYWGDRTYLGGGEFAGRLGGAPTDIINPNGLGFVIATLFPFMHYLWGNSNWRARIAYLSCVPPLLYALVLTMSRSGLVAVFVIFLSIFIKSRHKVTLILVSVIISTLAWNNMNDIQKDRYLSLTGNSEVKSAATFQGRIDGVVGEFKLGLENPVVGFGLGTSKEAIHNIMGGKLMAHDLYTETFIETGIIGLVIFILFIKSIYKTLRQITSNLSVHDKPDKKSGFRTGMKSVRIPSSYEMNLQMALMSCFWMYLIFSIAQYGLSEYHWYFLAGVATVLDRRTRKNPATIESADQSTDKTGNNTDKMSHKPQTARVFRTLPR